MISNEPQLRALHATYCRLTRNQLALTMERLLAWERWESHMRRALGDCGVPASPEQALIAVVAHRRRQFAERRHILVSVLAFSHLVGRPELAEEDFAAWRAWRRERASMPDAGRAEVCRASGRPDGPPERPPRPVGTVLQQGEMLDLVNRMRAAVGG